MHILPQPYGLFHWLMEVIGGRRAIELDIENPPNSSQMVQDIRARLWAPPAKLRSESPETIARPASPVKHIPMKRKSASQRSPIEISTDDEVEVGPIQPRNGRTKHVSRQTFSISPPNSDDGFPIEKNKARKRSTLESRMKYGGRDLVR